MKKQIITFISLFLFNSTFLFGYNYLPVVKSFDKNEYKAGRQNWSVGVDSYGVVYFGNNDGLLSNVYGIWQLNKTDNKDIIRSLHVDNDTIWCGGNSEFGYFVKSSPEDLNYQHMGIIHSGSAWNTKSMDGSVFFQSEGMIAVYHKQTQEVFEVVHKDGFYAIAEWKNKMWAVARDGSLGTIENNRYNQVYQSDILNGTEVRQLFVQDKKLLVLLFDGRLFTYANKQLIEKELPPSIAGKALFTSCSFNDQLYGLGSISDGLVLVNENKGTTTIVNTDNGLIDNTVLAIAKDQYGNLWLGLDYGIAYVELQNSIKPIFNQGATYSFLDYKGKTYLATNKGLFTANSVTEFNLVPGSEGQVWNLKVINEQLFVCHNLGLFEIEDNRFVSKYTLSGVMDIAGFEVTNNYVISTYDGLFLAAEKNGKLSPAGEALTVGSSKLIYDSDNECIWATIRGEGICKCEYNRYSHLKKTEYKHIKDFFLTEENLVFYDGKSLFTYEKDQFKPLETAPYNTIKGKGISALVANENLNTVAYIQNGIPEMLVNLYDGNFHSYHKLLSSVKNKLVENHEFIDIHKNKLRIATDRGVVTFNQKAKTGSLQNSIPVISKMIVLEEGAKKLDFTYPYINDEIDLSTGDKDILFHFGIAKSSSDFVEFRYRLWPYDKDWSEWNSVDNSKAYTKLKGGIYTFKLESRMNGAIVKKQSLSFNIKQYWFQTNWIILMYLLFFALCIVLTVLLMNRVNRNKLKREQENYKQDAIERDVSLKNEQLLQYAEIISKKNEFLLDIKNGLSRMRNNDAKLWENKILDEVGNEKKQFFFYKLFSEVHQDFIDRLTEKHPALTAHDVRILSFIRINLGAKEIANLMNISPKSVDINRYRIRKKMNLSRETDLNLYIREL